jgi:hypothetical protein
MRTLPGSPQVPEFPHYGEGEPLSTGNLERAITTDYDHGLRPNHNHHPKNPPKRVVKLAPLPARAALPAVLPSGQGGWWRGPGEMEREVGLANGVQRERAFSGLHDDTSHGGVEAAGEGAVVSRAGEGRGTVVSIDHKRGFLVERRAVSYVERGYAVSYYWLVAAATAALVLACLAASLGVASRFGQQAVRETVNAFQPSSAHTVSLLVSGCLLPAQRAVEVVREGTTAVDAAALDALLRGATRDAAVKAAFAFEVDPRSSAASPRLLSFQKVSKAEPTSSASTTSSSVFVVRYDPVTGRLLRDGLSVSSNFSVSLEPWWRSATLPALSDSASAGSNWTYAYVDEGSPGLFVAFLARGARAGVFVGATVSLTLLSRSIYGSARPTGTMAVVDLRDKTVLAHSASPDGLVGRDESGGAKPLSVVDAGAVDPRLKDLTQAFKCLSLMNSEAPLEARGTTVCDPGVMAEGLSVSWSTTALPGLTAPPAVPYFSTGTTPTILSISTVRYEAFLGPNRRGIYYTAIILALVCMVGVVLHMACATAVIWPLRELASQVSGQEPIYANHSDKRTSLVKQVAALQRALSGRLEVSQKHSTRKKY